MNILVDYNQLENEVLKDSISDFLSEMRENLPEVFNSLEMKTVLREFNKQVQNYERGCNLNCVKACS